MESQFAIPRILIAGTHSGAGKTSITMGLLRALKKRGKRVQAFKVGPDYIDPGWHAMASGMPAHNIDSWMSPPEVVKDIFYRNGAAADIAVIEGVMGLYDGSEPEGLQGSTAEIALMLQAPVILVADGRGIGSSILAMIAGYRDFEPSVDISGVIVNRGGDYHRRVLAPIIESRLGLAMMGSLPQCGGIELPERHLGLLPVQEKAASEELIEALAELVEQYIDLDRLEKLASSAPPWPGSQPEASPRNAEVVIAVARDEAFSFHYQDNLDYLNENGAELRFFSPLRDEKLPPAHGLILGGGFPEMFLSELAANRAMISALRKAILNGLPVWAECGGYMYLGEAILDFEGRRWPGLGILPGVSRMGRRLAGMGYRRATALTDSPMARRGDTLIGHEFHYASMELHPGVTNRMTAPAMAPVQKDWKTEFQPAYALRTSSGEASWNDGLAAPWMSASFLHIHLRSNPLAASRFLEACAVYRDNEGLL